ncbi:transposase [Candidatus Moduliflexus flocculans]|uniref:Transposase n=1 Tax=Candidatus Moduliflexus flocculans TaxID=1499966 RepID=A0A0S6VRN4_9BACT|nr:transposase [Candidatus Moduliflexus flocculans]
MVIAPRKKWILFLGDSVAGRIHDSAQFTQAFPVVEQTNDRVKWFEAFVLWLDLGYFGAQKTYVAKEVNMPHKKPRTSKGNPSPALTDEQKTENREISRIRVLVEQAMSGLKRCHIVPHRFRNRLEDFVDTAVLLAAGLWNWKLKCQGVTN